MKIFKFFLLFIGLSIFVYAQETETHSTLGNFLKGEHQLIEFECLDGNEVYFAGEITGEKDEVIYFQFMNKNTESEDIIILPLPLYRIRVKFDESVSIPKVRFKWRSDDSHCIDKILEEGAIVYALIICEKRDWILNIKTPEGNDSIINDNEPFKLSD